TEIPGMVAPVDVDAEVARLGPGLGTAVVAHRPDRSPLAGQLGRDPLRRLAQHLGIHQDRVLALPEHVDDAGGDDEAAHVEDAPRLFRIDATDGRDAIACDRDIGREPRVAGAVDDAAAAQEQVVRYRLRFGRLRPAHEEDRDERRGGSDDRESAHARSFSASWGPATIRTDSPGVT